MKSIAAFNPRSACIICMLAVAAWSLAGQDGRNYSLTASDDWMPYSSSKDPNGGMLVMIAKAAFGVVGRNAAVTFLPWNRALEEARAGIHAGIIGAWYSEERTRDFLYSDPIIKNEIAFFAFADRGIRFDKLEDLSGLTIGVVRGNSFIDKLKGAGLTLDYAIDFSTNLKKLIGGRIDVLVDERLATIRLLGAEYPSFKERIAVIQPPLESNELYLIVSRKIDDAGSIVAEFNAGLGLISRNGTLRRILAAYGANP